MKILNIPSTDPALQEKISQELGISALLSRLLINRGVKTPKEARAFLKPDPADLLDPFGLPDMDKAVELLRGAAKRKKKVLIFGDYDVDGITSVAVMADTLEGMGIRTATYVPHRIKEGYGLSKNIVEICARSEADILVTVDCGTNSAAQVKELKARGIETVITDHHEPSKTVAEAFAVVNPKLKSSAYKYRDLAGVGVAYKVCQALTGKLLEHELDLVALGTVADVVPLTGENRVFVKEGLKILASTRRPGLKALMDSSGIKDKKITTTSLSYILGPRINASGRMDTAEVSLRLLLTRDDEEASRLAASIEAFNRQRQKIESKMMEEAQDLIDKEINFKEHKMIVVAKEDWHQGVLGIVASKLADRFYRPTILISMSKGMCKGSGRSIKNFHLFGALLECGELLDNFGGHSHAVGLVIDREKIADFKSRMNSLATEKLRIEDLLPGLDVDMEIDLSELDAGLTQGLRALEPFGQGNPEPLFYARGLKIKGQAAVLGRETLKFWATDGSSTYPVIGFGMAQLKETVEKANSFDLIFSPKIDDWRGGDSLVLEVKEVFAK